MGTKLDWEAEARALKAKKRAVDFEYDQKARVDPGGTWVSLDQRSEHPKALEWKAEERLAERSMTQLKRYIQQYYGCRIEHQNAFLKNKRKLVARLINELAAHTSPAIAKIVAEAEMIFERKS